MIPGPPSDRHRTVVSKGSSEVVWPTSVTPSPRGAISEPERASSSRTSVGGTSSSVQLSIGRERWSRPGMIFQKMK